MNETHATKYLASLPRATRADTAERTRRLLAQMGEPQKHLFTLKILGEAGKSSASSLLAALFEESGISAGYISLSETQEPRLAMRIDGAPPSHAEFAKAVTAAWSAARAIALDAPSYEELLLAAALFLFSKNNGRVALVELSSDRSQSAAAALKNPRICLLTSSTKQGAERLLPLIDTATELISAPQEPSVYRLLTERAASSHCRLSFPTKKDVSAVTAQNGRLCFSYRGADYTLPTLAGYQRDNALAVIETYHALVRQGFRLGEETLKKVLSELPQALCFRFFSLSPAWLIDRADTPMRLAALAASVDALPSLFGSGFTLWTEARLAKDAEDALGERLSHLELFECGSVHRALKQIKPPKDAPLLVVGSERFTAEVLRELNSMFLFQ